MWSLQNESTENLLQMVQTEGLRPMLKREYDRGVEDGRKALIRSLAPELADVIEERERVAVDRCRESMLDQVRQAQKKQEEAEKTYWDISGLRTSLGLLKMRVDERDDERRNVAKIEAQLVAVEERLAKFPKAEIPKAES